MENYKKLFINEINEMYSRFNDEIPVFYKCGNRKITDDNKNGSIYNRHGIEIGNQAIAKCKEDGLKPTLTWRQFNHSVWDLTKLIEKKKTQFAQSVGLKVFKNGRLYKETEKIINSLIEK